MNYCQYVMNVPAIDGIHPEMTLCGAYSKSKRPDGRWWAHFPECSEAKCPLIHPELLEGAMLDKTAAVTVNRKGVAS